MIMHRRRSLSFARSSFILGVLTYVFCWCFIGIILGVIGYVHGKIALQMMEREGNVQSNKWLAESGKLLSIIGVVVSVIVSILVIVLGK